MTHTNTPLEKNTEGFFRAWFEGQEYFRQNRENWGFYPIQDDPHERSIAWALVRGRGDRTLVLIHHSDTVDNLEYGALGGLAYSPDELGEALKKGELDIPRDARQDLESGDWLFGRAAADMKGGAAIHMAFIEDYASRGDFEGNLLLLALPDEENLSAGMRSAGYVLDKLKETHGLDYRLMLNSEPHERSDDGKARIYDGSVGKIMPVVYVRGELAHVGQVYRGLNPINIMAEIIRKTELNPDFMERVGNTTTPAPSWLYMKDTKQVYDVSLPASVAGYMNILTLDRSPKRIMEDIKVLLEDAFQEVIEDTELSYKRYMDLAGEGGKELDWRVNVKTYDQIYSEALRDSGGRFLKANEELHLKLKEEINAGQTSMAEASIQVIERTLDFIRDRTPLVVLGLAPPYYPNVSNILLGYFAEEINEALEDLLDYAKNELDYPLEVNNYYTGISDLSYAMFLEDDSSINYVRRNVLLWGDIYDIPLDLMKKLSMPVLNLGPWGKDFHKNTERVYKPDLYGVTPLLIEKLIDKVLETRV